jgi:hypothetical protein
VARGAWRVARGAWCVVCNAILDECLLEDERGEKRNRERYRKEELRRKEEKEGI